MAEVEDEPTCPRHPRTVAYVRCQRCERPTCPECQRPAPVGILCVDCVREQHARVRKPVSRLGLPIVEGPPIAVITLIAINALAFLVVPAVLDGVAYVEGFRFEVGDFAWIATFGFVPELAFSEPWRWITSGFVHNGLLHIGLNMLVLYMFGRFVETALGRARFLLVYFGSMLGGGLAILFLERESVPHVGASGAVMGVIAAYIIVASRVGQPVGFVMIQAGAWLVAGFFVGGVSWQGHLGGAALGAVISMVIVKLAERAIERRKR